MELLGHGDATLVLAGYGHAMPGEVAGAGDALEAWRLEQDRNMAAAAVTKSLQTGR
jgi:uncharacterized protein (DUF1501 family)